MRKQIFLDAIKNQVYLEELGTWHNKIKFQYNFKPKTCDKCEGKGKIEDKLCDRCGGEKKISSWVNVDLIVEGNKTLFKCSCTHHSLHKEAMCQYILGVIFLEIKKQLRRIKKPLLQNQEVYSSTKKW